MKSPPQTLRARLTAARDSGEPFPTAWRAAVSDALGGAEERDEWSAALLATRQGWEAAYAGKPAERCERALAIVGGDPERTVSLVRGTRTCAKCGEPIPPTKHSHAIYCSRVCQRAANGRRVAA